MATRSGFKSIPETPYSIELHGVHACSLFEVSVALRRMQIQYTWLQGVGSNPFLKHSICSVALQVSIMSVCSFRWTE